MPFNVGDTVRGNASGDLYKIINVEPNGLYATRFLDSKKGDRVFYLTDFVLTLVEPVEKPVEEEDLFNLYWNINGEGFSLTHLALEHAVITAQGLLLSGAEITGIINMKDDE